MYTSQELMIYGIMLSLSRFWSVKRMPYVIHMGRNHGQTKELLIALGQTQAFTAGVKRNLCRCEIYDVCEIYDPNPISLTLIYDPNPNPNPIPCEILDACADSPIVINFASGEFRATPG